MSLTERALLYREVMDRYARMHRDESDVLSDSDWSAIKTIAGWLSLFREATTFMSLRDKTTISSVFGVFMALQDDIRANICKSRDVPLELKQGLLDAHEKLAEYFKKSDASPYYMWSACLSQSQASLMHLHLTLLP
jgi:hypothetical protein